MNVIYVSRGPKGTATVVQDDFSIFPDFVETDFIVKSNNKKHDNYTSESEARRVADKLSGKEDE